MAVFVTDFIADFVNSEIKDAELQEYAYCTAMDDGELIFVVPKLDMWHTWTKVEAENDFEDAYDSGSGYLETILKSLDTTTTEIKADLQNLSN